MKKFKISELLNFLDLNNQRILSAELIIFSSFFKKILAHIKRTKGIANKNVPIDISCSSFLNTKTSRTNTNVIRKRAIIAMIFCL